MLYELAEKVTWKHLNSCIVLLDIKNSNYYTLNETAAFIWECLKERKSKAQILKSMIENYSCDESQLENDLNEQLNYLLSEGLIIEIKKGKGYLERGKV